MRLRLGSEGWVGHETWFYGRSVGFSFFLEPLKPFVDEFDVRPEIDRPVMNVPTSETLRVRHRAGCDGKEAHRTIPLESITKVIRLSESPRRLLPT